MDLIGAKTTESSFSWTNLWAAPKPSAKSKSYKHVSDIVKVYEVLTKKYGITEPMELIRLAEEKIWPGSGNGLAQRERPAREAQRPIEERRERALRSLYQARPVRSKVSIHDSESSVGRSKPLAKRAESSVSSSMPERRITRRQTVAGPSGRRTLASSLQKAKKRLTRVETSPLHVSRIDDKQ